MQFLQYVLALVVTLGILVTIHELGHYLIARASGVKILRFCVGMGKTVWSRYDRRGTEFAIAVLPLGGYLRMCDDQDVRAGEALSAGEVTYSQLTPWWRIAIALGGPIANFLLAIVVYWALFVAGTLVSVPMLGTPTVDSVAASAGLPGRVMLVEVDGSPVHSWQEVSMALAGRLGDSGQIELGVQAPADALLVSGEPIPAQELTGGQNVRRYRLPIESWHRGSDEPDLLGSLGLTPMTLPIVGMVVDDSAAQRGGLQVQDQVLSVAGIGVESWHQLVGHIEKNPQVPLTLEVLRNGREVTLSVTPEARGEGEQVRGFLGVGAPPPAVIQYSFTAALPRALDKTAEVTGLTLGLLKKMVVGQVSVKNLSGPITIAQVAGDSAKIGWRTFIGVLALLSVSLGVLNLLPIPILDGGHILFCTAELIMGRPVSERAQALGLQVGLVLVGGLMFMAIFNDIARLL